MNDTTNQPFVITHVFDAPRDLVWKAYTEAERLMHWWGPKGFTMIAANVDLRPGGVFHYGLRTPGGQEMWGKWTFLQIVPPERLVYVVSFSDEQGGTTRHPMSDTWPLEMLSTMTLSDEGGKTTITMTVEPHNATDEEAATFDAGREGMTAGFAGTMDQLAAHLASTS